MKRKLVEIMNNIPEEHLLECIQSFGYLSVNEKKEKRKNVDYQWSEYIVYIILYVQ